MQAIVVSPEKLQWCSNELRSSESNRLAISYDPNLDFSSLLQWLSASIKNLRGSQYKLYIAVALISLNKRVDLDTSFFPNFEYRPLPLNMTFEKSVIVVEFIILRRLIQSLVLLRWLSEESFPLLLL